MTGSVRVTIENRKTFCHINTLDNLTGTALGLVSVTLSPDLGIKAEICITKVKISSRQKTTVMFCFFKVCVHHLSLNKNCITEAIVGCKKCDYFDITEHCCCAVYSMLFEYEPIVYLRRGARHFF